MLLVIRWKLKVKTSLNNSSLKSHYQTRTIMATAKLQGFTFTFDPVRKYLKLQTGIYVDGWTFTHPLSLQQTKGGRIWGRGGCGVGWGYHWEASWSTLPNSRNSWTLEVPGWGESEGCIQEVCLFKEQLDSNPYLHSEKLYDYPSYILVRVWEIHFLKKFQLWF